MFALSQGERRKKRGRREGEGWVRVRESRREGEGKRVEREGG